MMLFSIRMRASQGLSHVSGGEGIYGRDNVQEECCRLLNRALGHERGVPDSVNISIEKLSARPLTISSLPVVTCRVNDPVEAECAVGRILKHVGICDEAIAKAVEMVKGGTGVAGALLVDAFCGTMIPALPVARTELATESTDEALHEAVAGDFKRDFNVRVSRFGITPGGKVRLSQALRDVGLTHFRVIEALQVASKAAGFPFVEAELCVSDDLNYTTGYVASRRLGYVRIPHIKAEGSPSGGRVFFLNPAVKLSHLMEYMKKTPVIIDEIGRIKGVKPLEEILCTADS
ncbi:MAG: hypothetical protein HQK89_00055 [Nitrospirae bacterium]|nr:hypothetical protein [Nitrospirota bacterium]